ncbi:MucBP domain-containing protein [Companilactobacillus allii]|uniref:MucBP domain-containing protein n=1 Tax=Companilactobacillus allii TaxID=1847728 RepID=A0A1P8Q5T8_9LACO|nr:MucBP domain-containing protein [Companilactobacillus allii]APX73183.1 hypothetical protein BTM29_11760 [Companilactobacillus allii]USQ67991.1 MucBP domain-containing protein [Companilactobacillus allii]
MNFKKYAILSMGLWVLGFGVYESQPVIAHADEQTTTSNQVKTTLSSTTNTYWYDGSVKLPDILGDSISNRVVAHFTDGQSDIGEEDVTVTVDPKENTSYNFSNDVDENGLIELQGKVVVGDVKVKYVDTDGNEIATGTEATHSNDQTDVNYLNYTTKQLSIDGYTFVKMGADSLPANGSLSGTGGTVVYVCKASSAKQDVITGNDDPKSVTNAASAEVVTSESDDSNEKDTSSETVDNEPSQTADSTSATKSSDEPTLLNTNDNDSNSETTQQSGLLPSTTTVDNSSSPSTTSNTTATDKKSDDTDVDKTAGQTAADQGLLPQTSNGQTAFYTTLASFSLVSLLGLIGIRIIKH